MSYYRKMTGRKCYLSPIDVNDAEKYTRWLNDMEVAQYLTLYHATISLSSEEKALQGLAQGHHYAIVDLTTNELIGGCGIADIDSHNRSATVGIFIGEAEFRGKGYGTDAMRLLVDYGFAYLDLENIMLQVYEDNPRALRCYEKVGFREIGRRRRARRFRRRWYDIILMDILPEDFYGDEEENPDEAGKKGGSDAPPSRPTDPLDPRKGTRLA